MSKLTVPVRKQDHIRGSMNAPVTLIEYGDFECPYCGAAYGGLLQLEEEMGPTLRFVFRHFPLTSIHPHAEGAALAAEIAGAQGKFWEMHDLLFENQQALEVDRLLEYAQALDLEISEFEADLRAGKDVPRIKEDIASGIRSGVNGTPTFFINGVRHDGSFEYPVLLRAVKEAAEAKLAH
jgi:protein-disulfide isomerase